MIRIRIKDSHKIQYAKSVNEFAKQNRHGSIVKSFVIKNGAIDFFDSELETKMIPKKHATCFENIPFKIIRLDGGNLIVFQDPNNTLRLLRCENGWIQPIAFDELTEDDDIVIYDDNEKEWAINGIAEIKYFNVNMSDDNMSEDEIIILQAVQAKMSSELSAYMIKMDTGLIVNGILMI